MRFAQIRNMDISNGENIGVALFVQGCHFHCYNCFNSETWNFNGGYEWTEEIKQQFLNLINKPYIKRISFLGGEPLADENVDEIYKLLIEIRSDFPNKNIWLYTGYIWEEIHDITHNTVTDIELKSNHLKYRQDLIKLCRHNIIKLCDVVVDGRYIDNKRDISLQWRGSRNQRVIDVQKSVKNGEVILWEM